MRRGRVVLAAIVGWMAVGAPSGAQAPDTQPTLTVDVVAVDREGRPAGGLRAEDFDVRSRGQARKIVRAQFVPPSEAPRTVVFVVDDMGMSFRSAGFVREALQRFVDDQMRDDDRVAIVRTYSTYSNKDTTQTTTSDRKALRDAVAGLRYNAMERGFRTSSYDVRYDASVHATLECLRAVVRDVSAAPGRKTVVLLSDGIDANLGRFGFVDPLVKTPLEEIVSAANRGQVVVYALDTRGVPSPFSRAWQTSRRHAEHYAFDTLARDTGGLFFWNADVEHALGRIMDGESGYYLLEYEADGAPRKGHSVDVKIRQPGIKARTRAEVFASGPREDGT